MNWPIDCILLDDEQYALDNLEFCLSHRKEFSIVGKATNLDDAFQMIVSTRPQAAFMDIRLQGGTVFHLFDRLLSCNIPIPPTVLVSGFSADAVTALSDYSEYVIHFIEKPYLGDWRRHFQPAFDKLIARLNIIPSVSPDKQYTFIKTGDFLERVHTREVVWAEVIPGGKSCMVTENRQYEINMPLKRLITKYPETRLRSCSREYAVNIDRVMRVDIAQKEIYVRFQGGEKPFEIGKSYFNELIDALKEAE